MFHRSNGMLVRYGGNVNDGKGRGRKGGKGRERKERGREIHREAARESFVLLAQVFKPSSDFLDTQHAFYPHSLLLAMISFSPASLSNMPIQTEIFACTC